MVPHEGARTAGLEAIGLDFNPRAVAVASKRGLPAFPVSLDDYRSRHRERFDAVALFHTLEHLGDPAAFLATVRDILRDGGRLVLSVPTPSRWQLASGDREWFDFPPHHLVRFTRVGLCRLVSRSGFRVLELREEPLPLWKIAHRPLWLRAMRAISIGATRDYRHPSRSVDNQSGFEPSPAPWWLRVAIRLKASLVHLAVAPASLALVPILLWRFHGKSGLSMFLSAEKCSEEH